MCGYFSVSSGSIGTDNSISVCDVDETQRSLTTVIRTAKHQIILQISMPPSYPDGAIPNFLFGKGTTIDNNARSKMLKVFRESLFLRNSRDLFDTAALYRF
jgi:hypothetical protein